MSDPRYKAGIYAGNVLSRAPGDWPDTLPEGRRSGGHPFEVCAQCNKSRTFVRYGTTPLCKPCAQKIGGK